MDKVTIIEGNLVLEMTSLAVPMFQWRWIFLPVQILDICQRQVHTLLGGDLEGIMILNQHYPCYSNFMSVMFLKFQYVFFW